jgi:hypothetical protein
MITDRSLSDVNIAESLFKKGFDKLTEDEKKSFLQGLKGAYNYTDFNRIESVVKYLTDRMKNIWVESEKLAQDLFVGWDKIFDYPYTKHQFDNNISKTNWNIGDILNQDDRKRYIDNIISIIAPFLDISDLPTSLENMDFIKANNIENGLINLNNEITKAKNYNDFMMINASKSWFFSDDLYGGEI